MRIMEKHLHKDICGLQSPGISRAAIDPQTIDHWLPAEIQYACLYWVSHIQQGMIRVRDDDQVHDFLTRHFLHWVEALSLMGRAAESIGMIKTLQTLVEVR